MKVGVLRIMNLPILNGELFRTLECQVYCCMGIQRPHLANGHTVPLCCSLRMRPTCFAAVLAHTAAAAEYVAPVLLMKLG